MRVGVISDLHADIASLEMVLQRFEREDISTILCGGDLVERGSDGNAVVEILQGRSIPCVKGNHDENALRHARLSRDVDEAGRLSAKSLEFLEALPPTRDLDVDGVGLLLAHAIPSDNGGAAFSG